VAEQDRPIHAEGVDQLEHVPDVLLDAVAGRRLVGEAVSAQVDGHDAPVGREPLAERCEAISVTSGAVDREDRRVLSRPVDDVHRDLLQRDQLVERETAPKVSLALEAERELPSWLGVKLCADDAPIPVVGVPCVVQSSRCLGRAHEQHVPLLEIGIDLRQAAER
jgi:hypothetical protein